MDPQPMQPPMPQPSMPQAGTHKGLKTFLSVIVVLIVVLFVVVKIFGIGSTALQPVCPPTVCIFSTEIQGQAVSTPKNNIGFVRYNFSVSPLPPAIAALPVDPKPLKVTSHYVEMEHASSSPSSPVVYLQTYYSYLSSKTPANTISAFQSYLTKNNYTIVPYTSTSTDTRALSGHKVSGTDDMTVSVSVLLQNQFSSAVSVSVTDAAVRK